MWSRDLTASRINIAWRLVLGAVKWGKLRCGSCVMPWVSGRWCWPGHCAAAFSAHHSGDSWAHNITRCFTLGLPVLGTWCHEARGSQVLLNPQWHVWLTDLCLAGRAVWVLWTRIGVCACVTCLRSFWGGRVYPVDPRLPIQELVCSMRCFGLANCYAACLWEPCWRRVLSHRKTLSILNHHCRTSSQHCQNNVGISMRCLWIKLRITFVDYWAIDQRCTYYRNVHSSKENKKKYWKPTV